MRSRLLQLLLLTAALGGCIADSELSETPLVATSELTTYGVVELTATSGRGATPAVSMHAHFMAYAGIEREALLRGLDVWEPPAQAGCQVIEAPRGAPTGTVHLLDAGRIGYGSAITLQPRSVPSYLPRFHGVLYATDTPQPLTGVDGQLGTVWVDGGQDVPPFATDLDAPPAVRIAQLNGVDTREDTMMTVDWATGLELELATASSEAFVEIRSAIPVPGPTIACWVDADAPLHIDAAELETIFPGEDRLEVVARTAHHTSLPSPAEMDGSVIFDYADRIEVERR